LESISVLASSTAFPLYENRSTINSIIEIAGEREDFAIATLDQFVAQVNFDGVEFDKGLR